ncbi:MAG: aminoglycoside phosphotransferase family protein [Ferruginibacter sp.]
MLSSILALYGLPAGTADIKPFGSGLINRTWIISSGENNFILQRVNDNIFKNPLAISGNTRLIGTYLAQHHPGYLFVTPVTNSEGKDLVYVKQDGYYRLFPFVKNSHTVDVVSSPAEAFEAARQFGRFTNLLNGFPAEQLQITLPDFHNLPLRYQQFETALASGNRERIRESHDLIGFLKKQQGIVETSIKISLDPSFKKRVTHHDTKISNVLFSENNQALCVIDLDTVMPGYFISDAGDMMRTYLSPVSEEEKDFSKIIIRKEYFKAIAEGYLGEMKNELSMEEKDHFVYAGKFMIYMQALRFLTDHLNNDTYYGAAYEGHNFVRASNQAELLKQLLEEENTLRSLMPV